MKSRRDTVVSTCVRNEQVRLLTFFWVAFPDVMQDIALRILRANPLPTILTTCNSFLCANGKQVELNTLR